MRFPDDGEYVFPGGARHARRRGRGRHARRAERLAPAPPLSWRAAPDETAVRPGRGRRAQSDSTASRVELVERPRLLGDEPQRRARGAGGTSPRSATAAGAARSDGRARGMPRRAGTRRSAGRARGRRVAPRSISAWPHAAENAWPGPLLDAARRSCRPAAPARPSAKLRTAAAVYGPTPGSSVRSSGQPSAAIRRAARCSVDAPAGCSPRPCHSRMTSARRRGRERRRRSASARASARSAARRARPASAAASPRETRIAYGSRVRRQGRSRSCPLVPLEQQLVHGPIVGDSRRPS